MNNFGLYTVPVTLCFFLLNLTNGISFPPPYLSIYSSINIVFQFVRRYIHNCFMSPSKSSITDEDRLQVFRCLITKEPQVTYLCLLCP